MSDSPVPKRRLSIAIIVRNAAEALAETLVSVRNLADEIVVLDTGSTDDTPVLAEKFGVVLHRRSWEESFAAARNACLTLVTGEWVLWLDAGERLERDEGRLLREFVDQQADLATAYYLRVSLPGPEPLIAGEQIAALRLHPNRPGLHFTSRVRESLQRSLFAFGMHREHLPLVIERSHRDQDPAARGAKAERNIRLADLQIAERGPTAGLLNCLGEACQALRQPEQALQHFQRARELAEPASADLLEAYYGLLTSLEGTKGNAPPGQHRAAQMSLCMEALETFPLDAQLLCALGGYLQSLGQRELAGRAYEVAYRHGQVEPEIWHLPDIREIAAVCRASLLQGCGKEDEALEYLNEAWNTYPSSLRLGRQVVDLHVKFGRRDEALLAVSKLPSELAGREVWRTAVQGACAAAKGNWSAARGYLETAYRSGCRERFCLRWLCQTLLETGSAPTAAVVLEVWQRIDPASAEISRIRAAVQEQIAAAPKSDERIRVDMPQEPLLGENTHLTDAGISVSRATEH